MLGWWDGMTGCFCKGLRQGSLSACPSLAISPPCHSFLCLLPPPLQDTKSRPDAKTLLRHPWIRQAKRAVSSGLAAIPRPVSAGSSSSSTRPLYVLLLPLLLLLLL
ncbi:unnamed protein product [Closterium sp. NIES-54]